MARSVAFVLDQQGVVDFRDSYNYKTDRHDGRGPSKQ